MNVLHRILLRGILNDEGKKGHSLSDLNMFFKILDKITFTEEENKEYNFRVENVTDSEGKEVSSLRWNVKKDGKEGGKDLDAEKEFEFSDEQGDKLKEVLQKKNDAKEFTVENFAIKDVAEQLGLKIE